MNEQGHDRGKTKSAAQPNDALLREASSLGGEAVSEAKAAASEAASSIASQVRSTLDGQVEAGAVYIENAASSFRCASEDLTGKAPALANFVEAVADKMDAYATNLKGKTVDEIWDEASNFSRRQPALIFGLTAVASFLAYRTIKSARTTRSSQPTRATVGESYGA